MVLGSPLGGSRRHVHDLLFGLDRRQFRILYFYPPDKLDEKGRADIRALAQQSNIVLAPLRHVHQRPHPSDLPNLAAIRSLARRHGCRLFHGHGAKGGVYARLARLLSGGKAVYTPHGGVIHARFGALEHRLYWAIERGLRGLTDHYVLESDYAHAAMVERLALAPGRFSRIYNGVAPVFGTARLAMPRRPRIAVIGMIRPEKGQDLAVRAAHRLRQTGIEIELVLAGDGTLRPAVESLARTLGVEDCVRLLGDVSDTIAVIDAADIVLMPSRFESFGYVALEAMLRRRPVVAAAVGGLRETVLPGKTGILVEDMSPGGFAAAIADVIAGKYQFDFASAPVRQHLECFLGDTMVEAVTRLYLDLLSTADQ